MYRYKVSVSGTTPLVETLYFIFVCHEYKRKFYYNKCDYDYKVFINTIKKSVIVLRIVLITLKIHSV